MKSIRSQKDYSMTDNSHYQRLQTQLDKEVAIRDQKIGQIYKKMDEHYTSLSAQIREVVALIGMRSKDGMDVTWRAVAFILTILVPVLTLAFTLMGTLIATNDTKAIEGFHLLKSENMRVRDWKDQTEMVIPKLESQIVTLKEMMELKSQDRFTGSEAKQLQKQVDNLEDRLTYATKTLMELSYEHKGE